MFSIPEAQAMKPQFRLAVDGSSALFGVYETFTGPIPVHRSSLV